MRDRCAVHGPRRRVRRHRGETAPNSLQNNYYDYNCDYNNYDYDYDYDMVCPSQNRLIILCTENS